MPSDSQHLPRPSRRPDGRAVVRLSGHDHYLGQAGEWPRGKKTPPPAIQAEYQMLIARWLENGRSLPDPRTIGTVNDLLLAYDKHAEVYYHREGQENTQIGMIRDALRVVKNLFGRTPAEEFGPKKLKAVQQAMAGMDWSRSYTNEQVDRVRRMFKWAVAEELVPGDLYQALRAVPGLKRGAKGVRETEPVKPVLDHVVEATLPFLPVPIQAMVRLQVLTGMRPGEVCIMRGCDLEMGERVWIYRPHHHKTEHHGRERWVPIGPRAQEIVRPWLKLDTQAYLFSPAEIEEARSEERRRKRKSPMTPSQAARKRKVKPKRAKRDHYDETSLRNAIYRACDKAFPAPAPLGLQEGETKSEWLDRLTEQQQEELAAWQSEHHWHPNQLRHTAGTRIRKEYGLEKARIILGHAKLSVTEVYAEIDTQAAVEIMARIG